MKSELASYNAGSLALLASQIPSGRLAAQDSKRQELPPGAAMPLGKFQKGVRVREGMQIEFEFAALDA